jgi:hypothetical protein
MPSSIPVGECEEYRGRQPESSQGLRAERGKRTGRDLDILNLPLPDLPDSTTTITLLSSRDRTSRSPTAVALRLHREPSPLNLERPHPASLADLARAPLRPALHPRPATRLAARDDVRLDALHHAMTRLEEVERDGRLDVVSFEVSALASSAETSTAEEVLEQVGGRVGAHAASETTSESGEARETACSKASSERRASASSAEVWILGSGAVGVIVGSLLLIRESLR